MKKVLKVLLFCSILYGKLLWSQDLQRVEVFGAYSFLIYDVSTANHTNMNGWEASLGYNFNRLLAVEADVSGNYRNNQVSHYGYTRSQTHYYLVGPRISHKFLFGHALLGAAQSSAHGVFLGAPGPSGSATGFAMAFGGGVEQRLAKHFAVRGGADYLFNHATFQPHGISLNQNSFRVNAGLVYMFGGLK
ncbi:MAG TPA: outer membrane beta-barrel protein [Candidatus Eisenbacteria bacterium]|nr:outer membrane beta-barrel protein [Candidatus Eisenbacteria bacterium]